MHEAEMPTVHSSDASKMSTHRRKGLGEDGTIDLEK